MAQRTVYGMTVIDATKDLTIYGKKEDNNQSRCNKYGCAFVAGIRRQLKLPADSLVEVANSIAYVEIKKGTLTRFYLSAQMILMIKLWDNNQPFMPGPYTLKAVPKYTIKNRGKAHSTGAPKHGRPDHHRNQTGKRRNAGCGQLSMGKNKIHTHDLNHIH